MAISIGINKCQLPVKLRRGFLHWRAQKLLQINHFNTRLSPETITSGYCFAHLRQQDLRITLETNYKIEIHFSANLGTSIRMYDGIWPVTRGIADP